MLSEKRPVPQPYASRGSAAELLALFAPSYVSKRVAIIDLDQEARDAVARQDFLSTSPSAFAEADFCQRFIEGIHKRQGLDASLGGYLEDREFLWQGTYLGGTERAIHLGVDINVPAGTAIVAPFDGKVIRLDDDTPERFGWGPRVFIERWEATPEGSSERWVYIFAHLAAIRVNVGDSVKPGARIGEVGAPPNNGNWFPHLHVQKVRGSIFSYYLEHDLDQLEGYGLRSELEHLRLDFPEPFSFMAL